MGYVEIITIIGSLVTLVAAIFGCMAWVYNRIEKKADARYQETEKKADARHVEFKHEIKEVKDELKEVKNSIQQLDSRLSRLEGRFEERANWEPKIKEK